MDTNRQTVTGNNRNALIHKRAMRRLYGTFPALRRLAEAVEDRAFPVRNKERHEMAQPKNSHCVEFYTSYFGLEPEFYRGKRIPESDADRAGV